MRGWKPATEHHIAARNWLEDRQTGEAITCRNTQTNLLRLLTTTAVMGPDTCSRRQAWSVWDALMSDFRFQFLTEPAGFESSLRALSEDEQTAPILWPDDLLAAFAISHRLSLATFDRGYSRYKGLDTLLIT